MKYFLVLLIILFPFAASSAEFIDDDHDGITNEEELTIYFTNPYSNDTDGDGYSDSLEIGNGFSANHAGGVRLIDLDTDGDYLNDYWEIIIGTGINNPDSDGDLFLDGTEVAAGYDPLSKEKIKKDKFIDVDISEQRLKYYFDGNKLGEVKVSTGKDGWDTPEGEFDVLQKLRIADYSGPGYYLPDVEYNLKFTRQNGYGYYIHGAYWHNDFGTRRSHGCVNVSNSDMEHLYWFAQLGTRISVHQ